MSSRIAEVASIVRALYVRRRRRRGKNRAQQRESCTQRSPSTRGPSSAQVEPRQRSQADRVSRTRRRRVPSTSRSRHVRVRGRTSRGRFPRALVPFGESFSSGDAPGASPRSDSREETRGASCTFGVVVDSSARPRGRLGKCGKTIALAMLRVWRQARFLQRLTPESTGV